MKRKKSKSKFQLVSANFQFRAEWKKVTSRAELKNLQLELWLEPARLGLITINLALQRSNLEVHYIFTYKLWSERGDFNSGCKVIPKVSCCGSFGLVFFSFV